MAVVQTHSCDIYVLEAGLSLDPLIVSGLRTGDEDPRWSSDPPVGDVD